MMKAWRAVSLAALLVAGGCGGAAGSGPATDLRPAPVARAETERPRPGTTGGCERACATPAYRWDVTFGGPGYDRGAAGVALDRAGNMVVTGQFVETVDFGGGSRTSAGHEDGFVLALGCPCP